MRQKLLLADDSITVQRVIELTLADEDLDVLTVGDGEQAVEWVAREQPEIVLADVNMPGRDGYGVAEFVKQSPIYAGRTRVVLLTGAFEPIDQARADRIGIDGVLAKPFEPQVAIDLVRRVLSQPPVQPAAVLPATGRPTPAPAPAPALASTPGPAAAGYPFEPGAPSSKSAELDEYFKRLDEALASAGHRPSPEPMGPVTRKVKGRPMIETQQSASTDVTLGDAFSALLAAEQGEPSAATLPASAFSASVLASEAPHAEVSQTPPAGQLAAAQPLISEELLETVIRRVLEQMSDRLVRELVGPKVLDVAERLVREEIARLRAEADSLDA